MAIEVEQFSKIFVYLRVAFMLAGLAGNAVSFVVFSRKAFGKHSIGVYCRALCASNSFILFQLVLEITNLSLNQQLENNSTIVCKLMNFFNVGLSPISAWILAAFGIDKMIHVLNTNRFAFMKKQKFQCSVIFFCVFGNVLFYLYVPILFELKETTVGNVTSSVCQLQNILQYKALVWTYLVEANILPFILMMAATIVTIKCLVSSRKNLERVTNRELKSRREKDAKFALNSVVLNILFVILQVPLVLTYIVPIDDSTTFLVVNTICFFLFCLNYSISFGIYFLSNSIFRNEFMHLIRLRKSNQVFSTKN
jgi:hypothetical protein